MKDFLKNVRMREFEFHEWLDHKLKQVRLEEREACAKVCKDIANSQFKSGETETAGVLDHCAAAIRARGQK